MANVRISDLPSATTLAPTDLIPVVQSGITKKAPVSLVSGGGASNSLIVNGTPGVVEIDFTGSVTTNISNNVATVNITGGGGGGSISVDGNLVNNPNFVDDVEIAFSVQNTNQVIALLQQQGATTGQVMTWGGSRWQPADQHPGGIYAGQGAPTFIPSTTPALYFDVNSSYLYERAAGASTWTQAAGSGGGVVNLYELHDVSIHETSSYTQGTIPPAVSILNVVPGFILFNQAWNIASSFNPPLAVGDLISSTDGGQVVTVTSVPNVGQLSSSLGISGNGVPIWQSGASWLHTIWRASSNTVQNGQVLTWDASLQKWTAQNPAATLGAGNGIAISNGIINAALTAQDNYTGIPGTFYTVNAGTNLSASIASGVLTLNVIGSGAVPATAAWASGGTSKRARQNATGNALGVVNTQDVIISFTPTQDLGQITNATVSFNGSAASGTYNSSGTFPSALTMTIPGANIPLNGQVDPSVSVTMLATYDGTMSIINAGTLTNIQPIPGTPPVLTFNNTVLTPRNSFAAEGSGTLTGSLSGTVHNTVWTATPSPTTSGNNSITFANLLAGTSATINTYSTQYDGSLGAPINVPASGGPATASVTQATYTPYFWATVSSDANPYPVDPVNPQTGFVSTVDFTAGTQVTVGNAPTSFWIAILAAYGLRTFSVSAFGVTYMVTPNVITTANFGVESVLYNVYGFTSASSPTAGATFTIN